MQEGSSLFDRLYLICVIIASTSLIFSHRSDLGATFDEPFYIKAGLEHWRTGSYRVLMRKGTMPLPIDVQTLPIYLWEGHRNQPFNGVSDLDQLLPIARMMNLPFWWALLYYGWRLGRSWGGNSCGRLACGLLACEPSLLAHAGLATTDIALTAAVLAATHYYWVGRDQSWRRRVLIPGIAYGIALLCKASALLFVPAIFFTLGLWNLWSTPVTLDSRRPRSVSMLVRELISIGVIGFVAMFGYVGSDGRAEPSFVKWADGVSNLPGAEILREMSRELKIFPNAGEGLIQQIKHNLRGHHGTYVRGEWHPRAVWYYYPVVLSAKLSEPLLLLLAVGVCFRPRALLTPSMAITFILLILSLTCRVQLGVRLVFPLLVFLTIGVAVAIQRPVASCLERASAFPRLGRLALVASVLLAFDHGAGGLSYANIFWGGPARSPDIFTDSNHDWGQGLPQLRNWIEQQPEVQRIHVWYYGADPAILRPPFVFVGLQHESMPTVESLQKRVGTDYFALADSIATGCPDRRPETLAVIDWLLRQQPIRRVGNYRIYKWD